MASAAETVYWPFAVVAASAFLFATLAIFGGIEQDLDFTMTEKLGKVTAASMLYGWMNEDGQPPTNTEHFEKMAYEFCGKPQEQQLDWEIWGHQGAKYKNPLGDDDKNQYLRPYILNASEVSLDIPRVCDEDPSQPGIQNDRQSLQKTDFGNIQSFNTYHYQTIIPTRGAGIMNVSMEYALRIR